MKEFLQNKMKIVEAPPQPQQPDTFFTPMPHILKTPATNKLYLCNLELTVEADNDNQYNYDIPVHSSDAMKLM